MDNFKRREFVKLTGLSFATIALQLPLLSKHAQIANAHKGKWNNQTELNWDAFLSELSKLARSQHQLPWDQKAYTESVKQLLLQCEFPSFPNVKKEFDNYVDRRPNVFEYADLHKEVEFQVSLYQFEKEEYIAHHDHPNMTGVINVVSGNAHIKNYTLLEELNEVRTIREHQKSIDVHSSIIREVGNEHVSGGHISTLTSDEANIHSVMPTQFTQFVDVFTPAYKQDVKTTWYQVEESNPYEAGNLYKAEYQSHPIYNIQEIELSADILSKYAGTYIFHGGFSFFVSINGNKLSGYVQGQNPVIYTPFEINQFIHREYDVQLVFNSNELGQVESVTLYQGGQTLEGKKN